jgi:hypothetical protein
MQAKYVLRRPTTDVLCWVFVCRHTARFLILWLILLPLALWGSCGWMMVPTVMIISFVLLGECRGARAGWSAMLGVARGAAVLVGITSFAAAG